MGQLFQLGIFGRKIFNICALIVSDIHNGKATAAIREVCFFNNGSRVNFGACPADDLSYISLFMIL